MIWFFRILFMAVLITMLVVTGWASSIVAVWKIPKEIGGYPWFVATLFDTYFAFMTFFIWLAYKEASWGKSIVWLVLIITLGNIAMATYILIQLFRVPSDAKLSDILLRSKDRP